MNAALGEKMRALSEIIEDVFNGEATGPSGHAISVIQELVTDGRFDEVTLFLETWLSQNPSSKNYLASNIPGILLNRYLYQASNLSPEKVDKFWEHNPECIESIKSAALMEGKLSAVMASILDALSEFVSKNS